jgi:5-(carboxyamino)imidazole ribonucleotide synthase
MVKIGILGGGQLGKMFLQEAHSYPYKFYVLDPDPEAPACGLADVFVCGDFREYEAVMSFGRKVDILTIEIEDVNTAALHALEAAGVKVFPSPAVIDLIKDKGRQKEFLADLDIPMGPFVLADTPGQVREQPFGWPVFVKSRTGGYDGRGVQKMEHPGEEILVPGPWLLEAALDISKEISVIVSRNSKGQMACFPAVESHFHPTLHLVDYLVSPAGITEALQACAVRLAEQIAAALPLCGILAVEMFVHSSGELFVNELAPRPHNSGHASIEANYTSQFMQWLFAITGLPPGDPSCVMPAVMVNLLGAPEHRGEALLEGAEALQAMPGCYLHWYGKTETRPGRKMGHITVMQAEKDEAVKQALKLKDLLRVISL